MKGAIIGDIIGSAYINRPVQANNFQLLQPNSAYTDDTILTLSTADALLNNKSFAASLLEVKLSANLSNLSSILISL